MDRVVLGGCFLLLVLGVLIGFGISAESSTGKSIRDAFELLSFAGTAITGVVAVVALTSWRAQFRHSEKWKAIKKLQDALDGGRAANAYLNALFSMVARAHRVGWELRTIDFPETFQEPQKAWFDQCSRVDKAWQELLLVFDADELAFKPTHRDIEESVGSVATKFISVYLGSDTPDMGNLYNSFDQCSIRARDDTNLIFKQSGLLQRKLVR
jgi:hypothetical protein